MTALSLKSLSDRGNARFASFGGGDGIPRVIRPRSTHRPPSNLFLFSRSNCNGGGRIRKWNETSCFAVKRVDATHFDIVDPAVQIHAPLLERERHRWMRAQIRQLRNHVFTHKAVKFRARRVELMCRVDCFGGVRVAKPISDSWQMIQTRTARNCTHRTAVRVAAYYDVLHLKHGDRIFNGGRDAAGFWTIGRNDVAGIADHE